MIVFPPLLEPPIKPSSCLITHLWWAGQLLVRGVIYANGCFVHVSKSAAWRHSGPCDEMMIFSIIHTRAERHTVHLLRTGSSLCLAAAPCCLLSLCTFHTPEGHWIIEHWLKENIEFVNLCAWHQKHHEGRIKDDFFVLFSVVFTFNIHHNTRRTTLPVCPLSSVSTKKKPQQ